MKFYRTVVTVEVLGTEPWGGGTTDLSATDLSALCDAITYGDFSGSITIGDPEEVSAERMAELLTAQGSDPSFLLTEDEGDAPDGAAS